MKFFKTLNFSDVHLGCPRLDPELTVHNLLQWIVPLIQHHKPDLIGLQGDLFDTSISYSDRWSPAIVEFIGTLLNTAREYNVAVRVLRGTFSHDRTQSNLFPILNKTLGINVNLKYVDCISVEHIPEWDVKIGYIPDNVPFSSSEEVITHLKEKMRERGWESLDYLYMHGSFDHTLVGPAQKHCRVLFREEQFDFVKRFVVTGHIHMHSIKGRILNNGSLGRLDFRDTDEPKGCILIEDDGTNANISFLENPTTCVFKRWDLSSIDLEDTSPLTPYLKLLEDLPKNVECHIKVFHKLPEVANQIIQHFREQFPSIKFFRDRVAPKEEDVSFPEEEEAFIPLNHPDVLVKAIVEQAQKNQQEITEEKVRQILEMVEK